MGGKPIKANVTQFVAPTNALWPLRWCAFAWPYVLLPTAFIMYDALPRRLSFMFNFSYGVLTFYALIGVVSVGSVCFITIATPPKTSLGMATCIFATIANLVVALFASAVIADKWAGRY